MSFSLEMRANLPEEGAGPALRGEVDLYTPRRGILNGQTKI